MVSMDMYTGAMQQNSNSTAADRSIMRFPAARRDEAERVLASMPEKMRRVVARLLRAMRTSPPASLGVPFENE